MHLSVQQMTSLPVSVLVLGIGIARHQSIGYWVLGAKLGIVLTLNSTYIYYMSLLNSIVVMWLSKATVCITPLCLSVCLSACP